MKYVLIVVAAAVGLIAHPEAGEGGVREAALALPPLWKMSALAASPPDNQHFKPIHCRMKNPAVLTEPTNSRVAQPEVMARIGSAGITSGLPAVRTHRTAVCNNSDFPWKSKSGKRELRGLPV